MFTVICVENAVADSNNDGFQYLSMVVFFICVFVGIKYGTRSILIILEVLKSENMKSPYTLFYITYLHYIIYI